MSRRLPASVSSDVRAFLAGYPNRSPSSGSANLAFYQDKGPAKPSKSTYSALVEELKGNWHELEFQHGFIQWLFPIQEMGMNYQSQPLGVAERDAIKADPVAMARLLDSYRLMLEFYGQVLVSEKTGQIARTDILAPAPGSWRVRYANLLGHSHNFLRITRILKCNSEFGREHFNAPWILFFLVEQAREELDSSSLINSMDGYWRWCIRDDDERAWVVGKVNEVRKGGSWTEEEYIAALDRRERTGSFDGEEEEEEEGRPTVADPMETEPVSGGGPPVAEEEPLVVEKALDKEIAVEVEDKVPSSPRMSELAIGDKTETVAEGKSEE
ncbi:hypothetical protein RQP46_006443 [Phenoliferia psychrophenolica]